MIQTELPLEQVAPVLRGANHLLEVQDFAIPLRINYAYQFFVALHGKVRVTMEENSFDLNPGQGVIYGPGDRHAFLGLDNTTSFTTLCFSFRQEDDEKLALGNAFTHREDETYWNLADPIYPIETWPNFPFRFSLSPPQLLRMNDIMEPLHRVYRDGHPRSRLMIRAHMIEALGLIDESLHNPGGEEDWLEGLRAHLQLRASENIGRNDVARVLSMSASHLTHRLKERGTTFTEELVKTRMEKAKELLNFSSLSCKSIAAEVGFKDHSYFTKVFREREGLSPKLWRKAGEG